MIQHILRKDLTEYTDPPDGEPAELVTPVRIYGNNGAWREAYWDKGQVGVELPRHQDFVLGDPANPGEFHHHQKHRVFIVSPQKSPEELEGMLADAYLDRPDLERLHRMEERLRAMAHLAAVALSKLGQEDQTVKDLIRQMLKV